eukprot:TRINITY_DN5836_c0_g1_i5.p1 TRINITY_DN5836_c0_g1~~TRINITY_DN5836_c0_g1_i5.p1  ORF type:complete len:209 (-),score=23.97 TRINITY_DN5836_c0_g1_i5:502-1128(-)
MSWRELYKTTFGRLRSSDLEEHSRFVIGLQRELGIKELNDWYKISGREITKKEGGRKVMRKHNFSLLSLLQTVYPNEEWLPWKFKRAPHNFWNSIDNQKDYIRWLEKKLGITSLDMWYNVTKNQISQNYGASLLDKHSESCYVMLKNLYPDKEWKFWHFSNTPHNYWKKRDYLLECINDVKYILDVREPKDWYRVRCSQIDAIGAGGM